VNSFKESPSETALVENSDSIKLSTKELSLLSLNEAGRVLGNSINRTYALIYAVFINSSPILLSIMTSVRNLLELASQSLFGRYSDIYGRKPFLLVGLFISAAISFFFPIITDPVIFLFAMIIYSLAFSIFSPAWMAYLGDISVSGSRGSFIGKISTVGVLITFIVLIIMGWGIILTRIDYVVQYSIIFRVSAIAFFISGITAIFFNERTKKNPKRKIETNSNEIHKNNSIKVRIKNQIRLAILPLKENPSFRRFVLICAFMDFSMSLGWPIFGFIRERYASPAENSLMWAVFMGFQVVSLTLGGKAIDRYGKRVGLWGRRLMFLIPVVLFFATNWYELAIANAIGGIGYGMYFIAMNAYIIDSAPEHSKGNYLGAFSLVMGLVTFLGSISMGVLTELLMQILGKWDTIYLMLIIVIIFRFIGGLNFIFVKEQSIIG